MPGKTASTYSMSSEMIDDQRDSSFVSYLNNKIFSSQLTIPFFFKICVGNNSHNLAVKYEELHLTYAQLD